MGCLKVVIGFLTTLLLLTIVSIVSIPIIESRAERDVREKTPQAVKVFEMSREKLNLLRHGDFMANNGSVWNDSSHGIYIASKVSEDIFHEDWDTIDWLSADEINSIIYLMTSDELTYNFISISSFESHITARLIDADSRYGLAILSEFNALPLGLYLEDLEDGYTLWFDTRPGPGTMGVAQSFMNTFAVILAAIILILFAHLKNQKSKTKEKK